MKFVNRRAELAVLDQFRLHPPSAARHRAIVAFRRMGKTELIAEFRRRHPKAALPYVDVDASGRESAQLSLRLLAAVVAEAVGQRDAADVGASEDVLVLGSKLPNEILQRVRAQFVKAATPRSDPVDVLRDGILLADGIFVAVKQHAIIFFDECQGWFAGPGEKPTPYENMLREIGDRMKRLRFVFSGSAQRVMSATFREDPEGREPRPLHGRVQTIHLGSFGRDDARTLVRSIWTRIRAPTEAIDRVYALTRGHPAATVHLAEHTATLANTTGKPITVERVSQAFAAEVFERGGYLNAIAEADYAVATAQPRGTDALKRIVRAIAALGAQNATQARIADMSGVAQPNVAAMLPRLLDLDFVLLDEQARTYGLANPVVSIWLRGREHWNPGAASPIPPRIVLLLEEEVQRQGAELGASFEARVRDVANRFDGRTMPGRLFGQANPVKLPRVTTPVAPIQDVDREGLVFNTGTSVELDAYIAGPELWLGEARHRRHAVSGRDMKKFLDKTEFFRMSRNWQIAQRWFVSNAGFEEKALSMAREHRVLLTGARQLDQLARALGPRFRAR